MTNEYTTLDMRDVAQIEECPAWRANELLAAGYTLLGFMRRSSEQDRRVVTPESKSFIRHDFGYIVARRHDQEPFPARKPREPRPESAP
jgi:hypothetical protein